MDIGDRVDRGDANEERAVYVISVAAELAGVHPQTLRIYERKGLVRPERTSGEQEGGTLWDHESRDRGDFEVPWPDDEVSRERVLARVAASGSWRDQHVLDLGIERDGELIGDVQARHCILTTPPGLFELG